MTRKCGLFPFGITEVGVRCIDDETCAWVKTLRRFEETLIALPPTRKEAERELAVRLAHGHRFNADKALATSKRLFDAAFAALEKDNDAVGDTLCPEES